MKMTIIFNDKRGVINLTSHNVLIEDFKEHVCKRLKINPIDYKLKVDFLNNSIEPVLISVSKTLENPIEQVRYDLKKSHITYGDLAGLESITLGYGDKDYYTLNSNRLSLLKQHMLNKGGLDMLIYYNDVQIALGYKGNK